MDNDDQALMHKADQLLEQIGKADQENSSIDTETLLHLSKQHLEVWQILANAGYVPTDTESIPWKWEKLGGPTF